MRDREFQGCPDVLEGRARYLRQELGMGKCHKKESLTMQDEEILWNSSQLVGHNSRSLQHHVVPVDGTFRTTWATGKLRESLTKESFIKKRHGGVRQKSQAVLPKMFATGTDRCPVNFFL